MYHAGNMADVHKHMLLATALDYLTRKDKPLTYIETHAGRGLYDLTAPQAQQTEEAAAGIGRLLARLDTSHPYVRAIAQVRVRFGPATYPGSPLIAAELLRPADSLHLAELHPGEFTALETAMFGKAARCHHKDGFALALSLCPPMPRRGLVLIDPSYEIKSDYAAIPKFIGQLTKAWNVGIVCLWYPLLTSQAHGPMLQKLSQRYPDALRHEVRFAPARKEHRMVGSGMFVINPPFGLDDEAKRMETLFAGPVLDN